MIYANMSTVEAAILDCYKTDVKILKIQNAPLEVHLEKPIPYNDRITKITLWQPKMHRGQFCSGTNMTDSMSLAIF